jgi:glycosyltransferase involved in cell wall biosynthesis
MRMAKISIVLPVMNEAGNIEAISKAIDEQLSSLRHDYELLFVCDPSSDGTENEITRLALSDTRIRGIFLADRAGQTEAIRAGYESAFGDAIVSMDADFQDPPELLPNMIKDWENGSLIVHTKRGDRTTDTLLYRIFTGVGYKFLGWMTKGKVQNNVGDYRLIDRSILPLVLKFGDPNPFWRGITSMAGVKNSVIQYKRPVRRSGTTKYHVRIGSPAIALRGMASFSVKPLELLQAVGVIALIASAITLISITVLQIMNPSFPRGTPTLIALLALYFGVQFFSTAIIATYLIVIIEQTRRRPNYLRLPEERP